MNGRGLHLYRRGDQPKAPVPPVLPQVDVTVDENGRLDVLLDHEPYAEPGALERADLRGIVTQIAAAAGSAVRVDVREADGTRFSDFITPPEPAALKAPAEATATEPVSPGELHASGFAPHEEVLVVVVVSRQVADVDGSCRLRLPASLVAAHRDDIRLMSATAATPSADVGAA